MKIDLQNLVKYVFEYTDYSFSYRYFFWLEITQLKRDSFDIGTSICSSYNSGIHFWSIKVFTLKYSRIVLSA